MIRKIVLVAFAIVAAGALALALYARSVLASDHVRAALEQHLTRHVGEPVRIASASASIFPRVALELADVTVGEPPHVALARVSVSTGLRGLFSRRVEQAEVRFARGRVTLPAALALTTLPAQQPAHVSMPALTIASVRTISLRDLEVAAGSSSLQVEADAAFEGEHLNVPRLTVRSPDTRLEASGTVAIGARDATFEVTAESLDIDELLVIASGLAPPSGASGGSGQPVRVQVDFHAASGRFAGYQFSDCTGRLESVPGRITMPALAFRIFDGSFSGSLHVESSGATPRLRLRGRADALDVARLAETAGRPGSITGRLKTTIDLAGAGEDSDALVRSTRGTAEAAITDGAIPGLEMVRTIVLAFGKPAGAPPPGSGSAFTRLGGQFSIQKGVLRSDNLTFASRDFDMGGKASLAVESGALGAFVDVILSKELTAQAGTDLRRYAERDGRVIIPAKISGTIDEPSIFLDLAAASRRALENELERRATSWLEELLRRKKGGG